MSWIIEICLSYSRNQVWRLLGWSSVPWRRRSVRLPTRSSSSSRKTWCCWAWRSSTLGSSWASSAASTAPRSVSPSSSARTLPATWASLGCWLVPEKSPVIQWPDRFLSNIAFFFFSFFLNLGSFYLCKQNMCSLWMQGQIMKVGESGGRHWCN